MSGASCDPFSTAKELTLVEASYLCCGKWPVTHNEHRQAKTAYAADIECMARRLTAEVPSREVPRGRRLPPERIFQSAAVWDFAKQNGFRLPWEASAESRSDSVPLETHLRVLGLLALALNKKSGPGYQRGEKPNVSQIAELVEKTLAEELPDANTRGLGNTRIRESIAAGLRQLTTDGKN